LYEDDTDGYFKIGCSKVKYDDKNTFVDGRKYKATHGLWELLTKGNHDKNAFTFQDRQTYKQLHCSLTLIDIIIVPQVRSKQTRVLKTCGSFLNCLLSKTKCLGNRYKKVSG